MESRDRLLKDELVIDGIPGLSSNLDVDDGVVKVFPDLVGFVRSCFQIWQLLLKVLNEGF